MDFGQKLNTACLLNPARFGMTSPEACATCILAQIAVKIKKFVQSPTNVEPAIICSDEGEKAVLLPLDDFNSWQETLYLLSNPANAEQ